MCQSLLVALFDRSPFGAELCIFYEIKETFKLSEIFEPNTLVQFQRPGNKSAERRVALPA